MDNKICIYGDNVRCSKEFPLEHIIPKGLVGNLLKKFNIFTTNDACGKCNDTLGTYVDGEFLNSWFIKLYIGMDALRYFNFFEKDDVPFFAFGRVDYLKVGNGNICELWKSTCGATILHIFKKPEESFKTYISGKPMRNKKNSICAIFINSSTTNPEWIKKSLDTFAKRFKQIDKYISHIPEEYNYSHAGKLPNDYINDIINQFVRKHPSKNNTMKVELNFSIHNDFDQRFLCKIAIGVGFNLFGEEYLESEYYEKLKKGLWEKNNKKREKLHLFNSGLLNSDPSNEISIPGVDFGWDGGITINLCPLNEALLLFLNICGKLLVTTITDSTELIRKSYSLLKNHGVTFLIIPTIDYCEIFSIIDFTQHKMKLRINAELKRLEELRDNIPKPPPKMCE